MSGKGQVTVWNGLALGKGGGGGKEDTEKRAGAGYKGRKEKQQSSIQQAVIYNSTLRSAVLAGNCNGFGWDGVHFSIFLCMVLRFGFVTKPVLVTHQCFCYC